MPTISITAGGHSLSISASDAQVAGLTAARLKRNESEPDDGKFANNTAYFTSVMGVVASSNPDISAQALTDIALGALASYAGETPPAPETPELTADERKAILRAKAAAKRFAVEVGGITVGGMAITTDRATQNKLAQAVLSYQTGALTGSIDWKGPAGWLTLSQMQITTLAGAVALHVQTAFSAEKTVCEAIDAGTITIIEQVDGADDWP